jgi:hypothetical protein
MKEKSFAHQVEYLLDLYGWRWCHYEPAIRQSGSWATPLRGDKGEPDYRAVRSGRLVFVEIKGDGGRLTKEQKLWIADLVEAGVETYVWHPEDLEIAKEVLR